MGGCGRRLVRHRALRADDLQERLDRAQTPQPEHQCLDEHRGDRRRIDWAVARSGDGHVAVHRCRNDRGKVAGSCTQCHQGLDGFVPGTGHRAPADGSWLEVDVKTVEIGALVRVRPGERIGLDGEVTSGNSTVNQAPITGESLPIEKAVDDPVYAGSINESGSFEYRVTAEASNTTLARIIHAVEEAQSSRAPTQRFVDQFAKVYTPAVFFFALAIAVFPPLFMGGLWTDWIYRALVLLVVACPCALVISTPVSIVSGLAAAARKGILVKGGVYLEIGAKLSFVALDKTGTITHGKPVQTDYLPLIRDFRRRPADYCRQSRCALGSPGFAGDRQTRGPGHINAQACGEL